MPAEPFDQQVGEAGGEDPGLPPALVEVGVPVHGVLLDVPEHVPGDLGHPGLGVPVGGGGVSIHRAEVAVALDEGVAHGEVLGQADQGVIHGTVPVGVVLTQHIAYAGGGFLEGFVGGQATLVHGVQDSPVDGLQAVPHIGQGPAHDDGHGVVDVTVLHLLDQLGLHDMLVGEGDVLRAIVFVFCHSFTPLSPPPGGGTRNFQGKGPPGRRGSSVVDRWSRLDRRRLATCEVVSRPAPGGGPAFFGRKPEERTPGASPWTPGFMAARSHSLGLGLVISGTVEGLFPPVS